MSIPKTFEKYKSIQIELLDYLEDQDESGNKRKFQNFLKLLDDNNIKSNKHEFRIILNLIEEVSSNHHRCPNFISKIKELLQTFQNDIKKSFTNIEIFDLFKGNRLILLFLIDQKILDLDLNIYFRMLKQNQLDQSFAKYFQNEFIQFSTKWKGKEEGNYEENRRIGENESYICQLIRQDLLDEFDEYINKSNTSLKSSIKPSIYETNQFLIRKELTLIQYAAFYGSIKIFRYLLLNNVELDKSLWLYAIHSNDAQLIHLLEENIKDVTNNDYKIFYEEAAKCHHNNIADYFMNNFLDNQNLYVGQLMKYCNFNLVNDDANISALFCFLYENDILTSAEFLVNQSNANINQIIILKKKSFFMQFYNSII